MSKSSTHVPGGNWSESETERGLVAVAIYSGNTRRAARALAEQGLKISHNTLRAWVAKTHSTRYLQLREQQLPELKARLAEQHEDLARRQIEVSAKLTNRLSKEADDLPIRDVSTAQRNLDVGSGIHTQGQASSAVTPPQSSSTATLTRLSANSTSSA